MGENNLDLNSQSDDQINNPSAQPEELPTTPAAVPPEATTPSQTADNTTYGTGLQRLGAFVIDVLIIATISGILSAIFGTNRSDQSGSTGGTGGLVSALVAWAYFVSMDVKYGATLGKKALHLKVVSEKTGNTLTVKEAIFREILGKFVTGLTLSIGYLMIIWDKKKQALHDRLAGTIVIKA